MGIKEIVHYECDCSWCSEQGNPCMTQEEAIAHMEMLIAVDR